MARENAKSYLIGMKFGTYGFLGSLSKNLASKFSNLKWWVQYGGPKCKKQKGLLKCRKVFFAEYIFQIICLLKMYILGFFGLLIASLIFASRNSR